MDIKSSNIKINSNSSAGFIINESSSIFNYDPLLEISGNQSRKMTNEETNKMISLINDDLSKDDHILIYKMLRKHKNRNFFSSNSSVTHFNITELDNKMKWELYRFVLLCSDNIARKKAIKQANKDYNIGMKETITDENYKESYDDIQGLSEQDKFNNMLALNEIGN